MAGAAVGGYNAVVARTTEFLASTTLSVTIEADPSAVYDLVSHPEHLPRWATTFVRGIRQAGDQWVLDTPYGPHTLRLAPRNAFGVLDHYVGPPDRPEVYVPMRVVPNGGGSEVFFTLFRQPGMTDAQYAADRALVRQDLDSLKRVMEGNA